MGDNSDVASAGLGAVSHAMDSVVQRGAQSREWAHEDKEMAKPIHPDIQSAYQNAFQHMANGGDPVEAAHMVRAHVLNPHLAPHIWGTPSVETGEGGMSAGSPGEGGEAQQQSEQTYVPEKTTNITINHGGGGLAESATAKPWTAGDVKRGLPLINAVAAGSRLDKRLEATHTEGEANRGAKEKIASRAEEGKSERQQNAIAFKQEDMQQKHEDRMAALDAAMQRVRTSKGTDERMKALQLMSNERINMHRDQTNLMRQDTFLADKPEVQALAKKHQAELDAKDKEMEGLLRSNGIDPETGVMGPRPSASSTSTSTPVSRAKMGAAAPSAGAKIRVKLKDGRIGKVPESSFDASTMEKI